MSVKLREKRGHLYLDIVIHRKHHWETTGLTVTPDKVQMREVLRAAEIIRSKREVQIATEGWGTARQVKNTKTLREGLRELAKHRPKKDRVNAVVPYLETYGDADILLSDITAEWLRDFQDYLAGKTGLKKSTAASYMIAVRLALNQAVRDGVIGKSPAANVHRLKVPESERPHITIEDIRKLRETPVRGKLGDELKRAFLFACFTGLRISDLRTLTWGDIKNGSVKKVQYKTAVMVYIPLNDTAKSFLQDRGGDPEMVFPLLAKTQFSGHGVIARWGTDAGVSVRLSWHIARHTFAVLALEGGADIYTVSKLLGHTSVKTTEVYARATDTLRVKAVLSLPRI